MTKTDVDCISQPTMLSSQILTLKSGLKYRHSAVGMSELNHSLGPVLFISMPKVLKVSLLLNI